MYRTILAFARRRLFFSTLVALPVFAVPVLWIAAASIERSGVGFYQRGKAIVGSLERFAAAAEAGDLPALETLLAEGYSGRLLGLGELETRWRKDGVERLDFRGGEGAGRGAAVAEWRRYLAGFERVERVEMHIHRMEDWSSPRTLASVRFELIGTPRGEARPAIDRAYFRMRFGPAEEGPLILEAARIEGHRIRGEQPHFEDVAPAAGVDFENRYYPGFLDRPLAFAMLRYGPAGISAVDYDNDGFYDLFIPDGVESKLFRNRRDGTFEDVTEAVGLAGLSGVSVGVFADYDNDGHKDLFASRTFEPNQLFHNRGDGTFEEVTEAAGIGEDCCTTVASWADIDLDGDLDLYVGRYLEPRTQIPTTFYARNGEPNQLYRNEGDGTFTNTTVEAGVGELGLCLGTVFGDIDDDGDPDLYVVNDFGRNTLYRNRGDGRFDDVTLATRTLAYGAGMNASFGDYDNDGRLDIYVTNIRSEHAWYGEAPTARRYLLESWRQGVWRTDLPLYMEIFRQSGTEFHKVFQQMGSGNTLLRNQGDGTFADVTWAAEANPPGWFWGASFADFDNDGWQDLYAANGWAYHERDTEIELDFFEGVVADQKAYKTGIFFDPEHFGGKSWHGWERNRHLANNGDGTFTEIGLAVGTALVLNSRGVAVADFWNRGVLDIAVAASTDRHALLRNDVGLARGWLAVELVGAAGTLPLGSNRDAVGARVTVRSGGLEQMREAVLGDGYGSQNSLRLYFGLGRAQQVDELVVRWPRSGREQRFEAVPAGRIVEVAEGREGWVEKTYGEPRGAG